MVETVTHRRSTTIVLRPNRSASWHQTKLLIAGMSLFITIIALGWTFAGAWVVLPFAGLEISLLAFFMYRVCYKSYQKQVITVNPRIITVEQGVHRAEKHIRIPTHSAHLTVVEAETEFDITKLALTSDQYKIPLGQFLNRQDAEEALLRLQQAGLTICSNKWWKY